MLGYINFTKLNKPLLLILLLVVTITASADDHTPEFITFTFENDFFVGDDNGYTNGMGVTFSKGPFANFSNENLPSWLHWLSKDLYVSTMKNKQRGVGHMFFQRMQTPDDLSKTELIKNDVPYASLLAWQGTLFAWDDTLSEQLSLYLGAVGPITLAKETQTLVHKLLSSGDPKGWDNQIENELIFKVEAQRVWSLYRSSGLGNQFDLLGLWGAGIGTLESATKGGLAIRWGTHLEDSFPTFALLADRQINSFTLTQKDDFYLFFGMKVGWVFNSILINGNTFKESHSVPLEQYQDQLSTGIVWSAGDSIIVFQISSISSGTKLINKRNNFGALNITYPF